MSNKHDLSQLRIDNKASSSARIGGSAWRVLFLTIISCALGASLSWRLAGRSREAARREDPPVFNQEPPARSSAVNHSLSASGYVVAQRRAAVSSKATGRLKELRVKEGDTVSANEIIAVLENDDSAQLVKQAEAEVAVARARVQFAEAELENAQLQQVRTMRLASQQYVPAGGLDDANARLKKAAAEAVSAQANVTLAQAALEKAKVDYEYTLVRAPFDGTVLTKNADIGEIVAPFGSSLNARAAVVTIADMNSLQVEADVSEANISKVYVGQNCVIELDAFPGKTYQGKVDSVVPTVDRAKATVLSKIRFLSKDSRVIPEMSAKVEFLNDKR